MLSASRSVRRAVSGGRPLPEVDFLRDLYHGPFNFRPRFGQVTMIAGQPKSLKSKLTMAWVAAMNLPTLDFSADMAAQTAIANLGATLSGDTVDEVDEGLDGGGEDYYGGILDQSRVAFSYNPNPTLGDIYEEIDAWVELNDSYPQVIVVDNLLDVISDGESEVRAQKDILLEMKTLARTTGAHVFILHHMSESVGSPDMPSPRKALHNKLSQSPESVLSVAINGDELRISVVAARGGRQDPTGQTFISLLAIPERCQFKRWSTPIGHPGGEWWK